MATPNIKKKNPRKKEKKKKERRLFFWLNNGLKMKNHVNMLINKMCCNKMCCFETTHFVEQRFKTTHFVEQHILNIWFQQCNWFNIIFVFSNMLLFHWSMGQMSINLKTDWTRNPTSACTFVKLHFLGDFVLRVHNFKCYCRLMNISLTQHKHKLCSNISCDFLQVTVTVWRRT